MNDLREKVIKGFTCCDGAAVHLGHCQEDCPYFGESERADKCVEKLHSDALSLLKAQEPRVLTLEEVKRLLPGADVWIEYHDLTGWKIAAITVREIYDNGLLVELQSLRYSFERYGRYNWDWLAWCCWTSRPTDEQRRATPWEATPWEK